jgi:nucleoside 2-deoxyribosyltransferase
MADTRPRIYLAGPEVFLPDAVAVGRRKRELAATFGLEGVYPLDAELALAGLARQEAARRISLANEALMRSCDGLIANLTPFRSVSMDAGTAFEVGFMRALGRPVLGYSNVGGDYRARVEAYRASGAPLPADGDRPDVEIEDFGLAENLMISIAIHEAGGSVVCRDIDPASRLTDLTAFAEALAQARRLLLGPAAPPLLPHP